MSKSFLCSAVGKGRPRVNPRSQCLASYAVNPHARLASSSSSSGDSEESRFTITRTPMGSAGQAKSARRRAASDEVQSLFQRSSDGSSTRSTEASATSPTSRSNTTFLKLDFKSDNDQSLRSRTDPSGGGVRAPSDIKERLRQRAAERDRGLQFSPRGSSPGTINRNRSDRSGQTPARQNSRGPPKAGRRRRGAKDESPEKGVPFEGLGYIDKEQDVTDLQVYERVLQKYGGVIAGREQIPDGVDIENDPDMIKYREVMGRRNVVPDLEKVLEMPKGVIEEKLDSGLHADTYVERLKAMAEIKSKRPRAWAGLHMGEEQDVNALATQLRLKNNNASEDEVLAAAQQSTAVVDRWIGGVYEKPADDDGEIIAQAMRGVMMNQTYSAQDSQEFIQQFEKLVGPRDLQPKGKVADAVKAGAREAAMKTSSSTATTS